MSGWLTALTVLGCVLLGAAGCMGPKVVDSGTASWYGPGFEGRPTASGERFRPARLTAAHNTLPFGTVVRVERLDTGRRVRVVINDRGPAVEGRVVDLSKAAARRLGMLDDGLAPVRLIAVGCQKKYGGC